MQADRFFNDVRIFAVENGFVGGRVPVDSVTALGTVQLFIYRGAFSPVLGHFSGRLRRPMRSPSLPRRLPAVNNPSFQTDVDGMYLSQPCNGSWLALSPVSVSSIVSRYQHFSLKTLGPGLAAGRRMASVEPCSSRSQQKRPKTLVPGLPAGCRMAITRLTHLHLVEFEDLVQKSVLRHFSCYCRHDK